MCKLFKVSRSCYYNWIEKGSIVNKIDKELNELVKNIWQLTTLSNWVNDNVDVFFWKSTDF